MAIWPSRNSVRMLRRKVRRAVRGNPPGFTLIEVLLATVLLTGGILALVGLVSLATSEAGDVNQRRKAVSIAQQQIETLSALAYEDTLLAAGSDHADPANPIDGVFDVTWEAWDDDPIFGCKRVLTRVTWEASGKTKTTELVTVFSRAKR